MYSKTSCTQREVLNHYLFNGQLAMGDTMELEDFLQLIDDQVAACARGDPATYFGTVRPPAGGGPAARSGGGAVLLAVRAGLAGGGCHSGVQVHHWSVRVHPPQLHPRVLRRHGDEQVRQLQVLV